MQVLQFNDHLQSVYTDDGCSDLIRTDLFNAGYRRDLRKFCSVKDKCIDLGNSSNWSSDRISSHSNENVVKFKAVALTKLRMWIQSHRFWQFVWLTFDHQGFPEARSHGEHSRHNVCCALNELFWKYNKNKKSSFLKMYFALQTLKPDHGPSFPMRNLDGWMLTFQ